ncbi:MAG TPA: SirB2 family protein [Gammaproteobacteria bacterium]|nr:SirB2 family protein [Gammaproteobacteria bacterium]
MIYSSVKLIHITCVGLSVSLFAARGIWLLASGRGLWRWLRVVPHIVDTLLLASGITLAFYIHQFPFVNSDWLTAKIVGLIAYIALGVWVFRGKQSRAARWVIWTAAIVVFGYIVSVAITKQPEGFLTGII